MSLDPTLPAFFMPPNWREQLLERLQFRTDALVSEDYTTQTRATRLTPRRSLEYTIGADGALRRRFANETYARGGRRWYLPVWMDGVELLAPASSGSDTIAAATALRDFAAGGVLFIQSPDLATFELIEIADVGLLTVTLAGALANDYPRGSTIYPAVKARLDLQFSQSAFTGAAAYGRVKFNVAEPNPYPAIEWPTMHRGFPVLEDRPETTRDPETVFQWMLDGLDDEIGIPVYRDPVGVPLYRQAHDWTLPSRAAINRFRSMAYALEGKRGSIWVPTWADDLRIAERYVSGNPTMQIRACGAVAVSGMANRRDIRVESHAEGGTTPSVVYARVNSVVAGAPGIEVLNLGAERPSWPTDQTITQINWMALCRSETDNFEFNYFSGEAATVAMAWRARQNDV